MMSFRVCLPVSIFYLILLGHDCMAADDAVKPDGQRWLNNWEEGRKIARESGKPLFVVFRCEH